MEELKKYDINLLNLKNQEYVYTFKAESSFFSCFEKSLVEKGDCDIVVKLTKSETMIRLLFQIKGFLTLTCDRSLEEFDYSFETKENLILKFGNTREQVTEELEIIEKNAVDINVAQYIYEFVMLSIPAKKLHPKFKGAEEDEDEDLPLLVYSSEAAEEENPIQEEEGTDARWNILKKLKIQIDQNKN